MVQHFVFGTIFCANWTPSKKAPEAPKWNFINGPMGEECIAPWAVRDREGGSGAAGGGAAAAGVVGSSSNNSVTSGTGVAGRQGGQPPSNYPGGMPPTRAPWAK